MSMACSSRTRRWMISRFSATSRDSVKDQLQQYELDSRGHHRRAASRLHGRVLLIVRQTRSLTIRTTCSLVSTCRTTFAMASVTYPSGAPAGTCQAPNLFVDSATQTETHDEHEIRSFLTDASIKALAPSRPVHLSATSS